MKTPTMNNTRRERIDYLRSLPDGSRRAALRKIKNTATPAKKRARKAAR